MAMQHGARNSTPGLIAERLSRPISSNHCIAAKFIILSSISTVDGVGHSCAFVSPHIDRASRNARCNQIIIVIVIVLVAIEESALLRIQPVQHREMFWCLFERLELA